MLKSLARVMWRLASSRRGGTAIEYGLILAFVVLVMFVSLQALAGVTTDMWSNISSKVQDAH